MQVRYALLPLFLSVIVTSAISNAQQPAVAGGRFRIHTLSEDPTLPKAGLPAQPAIPQSPDQPASASGHHHDTVPVDMVDGKKEPNRIPDHKVYELFLPTIALSDSATAEQKQYRDDLLRSIGITDEDRATMVPILTSFQSDFQHIVDDYNYKAQFANEHGREVDPGTLRKFKSDIRAKVEEYRDRLHAAMTAGGWAALDEHVHHHLKRGMTIPASEALAATGGVQ